MKAQFAKVFYLIVLFGGSLTRLLVATDKVELSKAPIEATIVSGDEFLKTLKTQKFYPFYKDYIVKTKKWAYQENKWSMQKITDPDAVTKAARPDRTFYNDSILWYGNGSEKIGFRPIDTPTDCNSGCSPVVFHLVIDAFGLTLALLEEAEPLRKKYHVPFSEVDKKKLLKLAQELPETLSIIDHPLDLTESTSKQTWTFFEDVLIKDGAYTSFVVYNTAQKTRSFIGLKVPTNKVEEEEKKELTKIFEKPVNNEKELIELLEKLKTFLGKAKILKVRQVLLDNTLKAFYYLAMAEEGKKDLPKLIENYLNPFAKEYISYRQSSFLSFLKNLLKEEKGRKILLALEKNFKGWLGLYQGTANFLPFLAAGLEGDTAYLNKKIADIKQEDILNFASSESLFLSALAKAYLKVNEKKGTLASYARYLVRFPKAKTIPDFTLPKIWEEDLASYKNKELHLYAIELTRELHSLGEKLPPISGFLPYNKDKEKKIPEVADKKQLYIFFAPWCAHCHSLLKTLGETMPEQFWKKIQLVCSFSGDKKQLDQFLDSADFKTKAPFAYSEIIMLREDKETNAYYSKKLNMHAVPKIILTNKEGIIVDFSFELVPDPEKDLFRDLEIVFSSKSA